MKNIKKIPVQNFLIIILAFIQNGCSDTNDSNYKRDYWLSIAEKCKPSLTETIIRPESIVELVKDSNAFQGWSVKQTAPLDSLYKNSFKKIKNIIIDFGDHYTGYFTFKLNTLQGTSDGPLRFKFTFGEVPSEVAMPFDPYPETISRGWLQDEDVTVMELPATVTLQRRFAFRYVKIELSGYSPFFDFNIVNMEVKALTSAAKSPEPLLATTPEIIRQIDKVGQKTLSECMQTVFEDGPKRDQRLWVGDMYLEAMANNYSFENHLLTKRCLYLLAGLTKSNGVIPGTAFETPMPRTMQSLNMMDYPLLFNDALLNYVKASNDHKTANELFPVALQQINLFKVYVEDNGLINFEKASDDWWIFIDWKEGLHTHACIQGLMIFTLKQTYELAQLINREDEVNFLLELIEKMTNGALKLYDKNTGLFESGPEHQISYASQIWMILAGLLSEQESQKALQEVINCPEALKPAGPYMYHYFIQALINSNMNELAKQKLVEYWGGMINKGADTFWEVYDPENDYLSPYGFYLVNSYCHAWSCTPVYFIRKYPDIFQKENILKRPG